MAASSCSLFRGNALYHFLALVTVVIWGTTYVSTKVLIGQGLSPVQILLSRFFIAWVCIMSITWRRLLAHSVRDEALLGLCGLFGGTLYFFFENTALGLTTANNVSLIVSVNPLLTVLLSSLWFREPLKKLVFVGSAVALLGLFLLVFGEGGGVQFSPLGDALSAVAALMWSLYCLVIRQCGSTYGALFATRKIFFYGMISALPLFLLSSHSAPPVTYLLPSVAVNLLFLGVVASFICYYLWTRCVRALGPERASNYIYINSLVTVITSYIVLGETLSWVSALGAVAVVFGIFVAQRGR